MNCDEAIRLILEANQSQVAPQIGPALTYIKQHPGCRARLDQLTRAIVSDIEYELPCAEAREQLFAYYELETQEESGAATFPDLHNHLQRCPYCQFDYDTMRQGILAYTPHVLPSPIQTPVFALPFLPPIPPPPRLWGVQDQIRTLVEEISIRLAQATASFGPFSPALAPAFSTAVPLRGAGPAASYAALILPDAEADIRFHIETATVDQTHARVILQVFGATTNKAVAGARVTLRTAQRELLTSLLTENDGKATFPGLTEGKYLFQIRHQGTAWELSIVIAQQSTASQS